MEKNIKEGKRKNIFLLTSSLVYDKIRTLTKKKYKNC